MNVSAHIFRFPEGVLSALLVVSSIFPGRSAAQTTISAAKEIPTINIRVVGGGINQSPSEAATASFKGEFARLLEQRTSNSDKVIRQLGDKVLELENRIMVLERGKK
jgi:hypothetical protein